MSKTLKFIAILGVMLIITWAVVGTYQSCKSGGMIAEMKRDLRVAKASAELADNEYQKVLKLRDAEIVRLSVIITESTLVVTELEGDIAGRDEKIKDLNDALASLPNEDTIVTLRKRVDILTETVEQWKEKFVLSEAIISQKDTQIFALSAKYNTERIAHLKLQQSYNSLYEYNQALVRFNKELKKAYNRNRLWGTVKTAGLVATGVVVIYTILNSTTVGVG